MQTEDLGARFVVAVEDVSGVWSTIRPLLEQSSVLQHLEFCNKFGKRIPVPSIDIKYMLSSDPELLRLRPHSQNPVAWFRNPYAHLIVVSCEELTEYKASVRGQLRGLLEREKDPVLGMVEWVVLYVRPLRSDVQSRGAKKVFERLRDDFNTKKRERCVRLDMPMMSSAAGAASSALSGVQELETFLKESLRLSFEARQAAYEGEVRRLMASRMEPGWSFPNLFLVKDSLAIMLDAAGLHEDALREYYELEACYLEGLEEGGALSGMDFGGNAPGDDVASLLSASWRETRRMVLNYGSISQFNFRQFLFARQARLLMSLDRPLELAERAMKFIQTFSLLLQQRQEQGHIVPRLREVWVFSACLAVASLTYQAMVSPNGSSRGSLLLRRHSDKEVNSTPATGEAIRLADTSTSRTSCMSMDDSRVGLSTSPPQGAPPGTSSGRPPRDNATKPGSTALRRISTKPAQAAEAASALHSTPSLDWDIGLQPHLHEEQLKIVKTSAVGGLRITNSPEAQHERDFYCALGHLYSSARCELTKLGAEVGLQSRIQESPFSSANVAAGSPVTMHQPAPPTPKTAPPGPAAVTPTTASPKGGLPGWRTASPRASSSSSPTGTPTARVAADGLRRFANTFAAWNKSDAPAAPDAPTQEPKVDPSEEVKPSLPVAENSRKPPSSSVAEGSSMDRGMSLIEEAEARSPPPVRDEETREPFTREASIAAAELELSHRGGNSEKRNPERKQRPFLDVSSPSNNSGGMEVPPWLTEKRLQQALGDKELFEELFVQLSTAASTCYSLCGRWRNASIIQADVAALLLKTGQLEAATAIFQYQAQVFLKEGWHALLAQVLPKLITCYKATKHPALPHWIVQLFSLPPALMPSLDRTALQRELELAGERASAADVAATQAALLHLTLPHIDEGAGARISMPAANLQTGSPGSASVVDALSMLVLSPAPGNYTRYYGRPGVLSPGSKGKPAQLAGGAQSICVGDVANLEALLWSSLPLPITLSDVKLTLSVLDMPEEASAGARRTSGAKDGLGAEQAQLQCGLRGNPPGGRLVLQPGPNRILFTAYPVQAGLCALKRLTGRLGHLLLVVPATEAHPGKPGALGLPPPGAAVPAVGDLSEGTASPHTPATRPVVSPFATATAIGRSANLLEGGCTAAFQPADADVEEAQLLLAVSRAESRLEVTAVGFQGGLFAGQSQWLGVCLRPWHDTLSNATLQVGGAHHPARGPYSTAVTLPKRACQAMVVPLDGDAEGGAPGSEVRLANGALKLPAWAAQRPSLAWVWVTVGQPELPLKAIRLSSAAAPPARRPRYAPMPSLRRGVSMASSTLAAADEQEGCAELDVEVRYTSGCNRSHSCVLSLPVLAPFRMDVKAQRMDGGRIALELRLASALVQPAVLRSCELQLQAGLRLEASCVHQTGLLPLTVPPQGSARLLFFVGQAKAGEGEEADGGGEPQEPFTTLEAEYEILPGQASAFPQEVAADGPGSPLDRDPCVPLLPPLRPLAVSSDSLRGLGDAKLESSASLEASLRSADGEAEALGGGAMQHTLRQSFTIDTGVAEVSPEMEVVVRMLGPFTVQQGQAVHFCWRLERAGALHEDDAPPPPGDSGGAADGRGDRLSRLGGGGWAGGRDNAEHEAAEVIQYELSAAADAWRMAGPRRGQISLPRSVGATATVEAAWTPLLAGQLPLPRLELRGVAWREGSSPWLDMAGDASTFDKVPLDGEGVQTQCTSLPLGGEPLSARSSRSVPPTPGAANKRSATIPLNSIDEQAPAATAERPPLSRSMSVGHSLRSVKKTQP